MKKFLLFLTLFLSAVGIATAEVKSISSNFTDKDLTVGTGELGWTASIAASQLDSSRGVQFGAAKGEFTLTSDEKSPISNFKKIEVNLYTNAASNKITSIKVGKTEILLSEQTLTNATQKTYTYSYTGSTSISGAITVTFKDASKSIYVKSIKVYYEGEGGSNEKDCGIAFTSTSDNVEFPGTDYVLPFKNDNKVDVNFTSSNEAVATVVANESNMPKLTIKGIGTANIKASFAGNTTYDPKEVTFTLTVKKAQVAYLVTDVTTLQPGDIVIIANQEYGKAMSNAKSDNNRKTTAVTFNTDFSEITSIPDDVLLLKLDTYTNEGGSTFWTFSTTNYPEKNGYLNSAAKGTNNRLYVSSTFGIVSCATISTTSEGVATILFLEGSTTTTVPNKVRFNYNDGTPLFACYASGQEDVYIYKVTDKPETVETPVCGGSFATANSALDVEFMFTTSTTAKQVAIFMNDVMVGTFDVSRGEVDAILNNAPYLTDAKFKMRPVLESESVNGVPTPTQLGPSEALEVTWPTLPTFEVNAKTPKWYYQESKFYTEAGNTYADLDLWIYMTPSVTTTLSYTFAEFANSVAGTEIWGWYDENKEQLQNCKYKFLTKVPVTDNIPVVSEELLKGKVATATFTPVFLFNVDSKYSSLISGSTRAAAPALLGEETPILVQEVNGTKISESIDVSALKGADVSGVESVVVEGVDGAVEYYNMQGVRVEGELAPGMYIRRQGRSVSKVQIR